MKWVIIWIYDTCAWQSITILICFTNCYVELINGVLFINKRVLVISNILKVSDLLMNRSLYFQNAVRLLFDVLLTGNNSHPLWAVDREVSAARWKVSISIQTGTKFWTIIQLASILQYPQEESVKITERHFKMWKDHTSRVFVVCFVVGGGFSFKFHLESCLKLNTRLSG